MTDKRKVMSKYDEAFFAARAVLSDTSVPLSERADNLRTLMVEIEIMLSFVLKEIEENEEIDEGEEIEEAYKE